MIEACNQLLSIIQYIKAVITKSSMESPRTSLSVVVFYESYLQIKSENWVLRVQIQQEILKNILHVFTFLNGLPSKIWLLILGIGGN